MSDIRKLRGFGYAVVYDRPNYRVTPPGGQEETVDSRRLFEILCDARAHHNSQFKYPEADRSYSRAPQYGEVEAVKEEGDVRNRAVLWRDTDDAETDRCPFCGDRHYHSGGDGHRVAHCSDPWTRKEAETPSGILVRQEDGYVVKTRRKP